MGTAARGEANNIYPWGSTFDAWRTRTGRVEADGPEPTLQQRPHRHGPV